MGGFAATGGATASALLSGFGVSGIRLLDEIEPGVALGVTLGQLSIPVATKAGAFGDEESLVRIAARLRAARRRSEERRVGKSGVGRVAPGGRHIIKKKQTKK